MSEIKSNRAWREECESMRQQLASRDAEVAELKAENESLLKNLRGKHALTGATYAHLIKERDQLRKDVKMLRDAVKYSKHQCESLRTWGGMSWVYHPLQAGRIFNKCEEALAATEPKE